MKNIVALLSRKGDTDWKRYNYIFRLKRWTVYRFYHVNHWLRSRSNLRNRSTYK